MRLGIDLGTTRTVVAVVDRGNYPIIGFSTPAGDMIEHYPTISAEVDGQLVHGFEAAAAARKGAPWLGSWKRLLSDHGPHDKIQIGQLTLSLLELVISFLSALRQDLLKRSNVPDHLGPELEAMISVPANAHSTQRFITLEAFRLAGFSVLGMINEPSAAGLEYAHRYKNTITSRREHVVIYDLGGGTFDAALVLLAGGHHDVLATSGVARLGGDDFDEALLELALATVDDKLPTAITPQIKASLLFECRLAKEALNPNSRKIVLDLAALAQNPSSPPSAVIAVNDYYDRVRPLVLQSLESLEPVLKSNDTPTESDNGTAKVTDAEVAGIYVVGGASGLPLVPRVLRERFGRRVHRSPYPSAATAIGLAIAAEVLNKLPLQERFTRHLGVFRERDRGSSVGFDGIFEKGTPMPSIGTPPLTTQRRYRAAHNIGHFRFVECGALDAHGDPSGDITPHADVRFPFMPELRTQTDLNDVLIERLPNSGPLIEERYEVDASGVIAVTITDLDADYSQRYVL